ncbi:MAG: hypothetical protein A2Y92_04660 [Chloroflexi bacterium RBG_13_57_8]|nr:MAG: hypothetical protein A2Y92_04660 [Chloroflexi bacterium RBG_13_57_8]
MTFEQAAVNGAAVFAAFCAGCHGAEGQGGIGPALIGTDVELDDYGTADVLLGFISSEMPQNAPGSLQTQQYLEVTAYLLVKNNIVWPGNPFDPAKFNGIRLPD